MVLPLPWLLVFLPWAGALLLLAIGGRRWAARVNLGIAAVEFLLSLLLFEFPQGQQGWTHLDALNLPLVVLGSFIGLTTAGFSCGSLPTEHFDALRSRAYHVAFQVFMGAQTLALLADNLGVMWVAIELATLGSVLMVAAHGTPAAIEAAWKFFILCGVGIALALLGTVILYLAAQPLIGHGDEGLSWRALRGVAARCDAGLLNLAFVFLLLGYGAKAGLVPLHAWLPDAEAEGPVSICAVLSGLLLNAALHAILRAKAIVDANPLTVATGPFLIGFGLLSVLVAGFALWPRRDIRRFFAWSSVGHMGLAAVAFGLGGAANLAGLLHLLGHSLCKGAVFFGVGYAAQRKGSQKFADVGGLLAGTPWLGLPLLLAILGVAGLPPFALFASEFLLLAETAARAWWLLPPLLLGLLLSTTAKVGAMQRLCLGLPTPDVAPGGPAIAALLPMWAHLAVAAVLGVALPGAAGALLTAAAAVLR